MDTTTRAEQRKLITNRWESRLKRAEQADTHLLDDWIDPGLEVMERGGDLEFV